MKAFIDSLIFFLASATTLSFLYFKFTITDLQKGVSILLLLLLLLYNYARGRVNRPLASKLFNIFFLYASSTFVQLLVLSAGGFYSPFLILLHLYTLGVSFLVSLSGGASFLFFSVGVLIASIYLDPSLSKIFHDDPGTVLLYLASFSVIIPLSIALSRYYHLKGTLLSLLNKEFKLSTSRQESVLRGVAELVVVTDTELKIISINESAQKVFKVGPTELIGKSLFEVIPLSNSAKQPITQGFFQTEKVLIDKATRVIEDLFIQPPGQANPSPITIQISPVKDSDNQVNQLLFVLSDATNHRFGKHSNLDIAYLKHRELIDNLRQSLQKAKMTSDLVTVEMFAKSEDDLFTALELEDHPLQVHLLYRDVAELCQQIVSSKAGFSSMLGVQSHFTLPDSDMSEWALLKLKESKADASLIGESNFATPIDVRWFKVVIEKLLDMAVLLSSGHVNALANLSIKRDSSLGLVIVTITSSFRPTDLTIFKEDIFKEYYGRLSTQTNLNHGSGLEGFIVKTITDQLNIALTIESSIELSQTSFNLTMGKAVK